MSTILITGSTGNVASRLIKRMAARKIPVRAFVHSGEKVAFPPGVEVFTGDLADPERVRSALRGVSKVYLLTAGAKLAALEANVIDAATAEKVERLVKHSVQGAQSEATVIGRWHRQGERRIERSGLPYTFLRPASFATNALSWAAMIKRGGTIYSPYGEAALPVIDPEDVAAVAEKVLTERGHTGRAYELTGPTSLTVAEQVAIIGKITGRSLKYVNVPDEAARQSMVETGVPPDYADAVVDLVKVLRGLGNVLTTSTVQDLLGRAPRTFEQFIRDNAAAFR
jgi:uncharacterized protein YbjT (DUF2867 family)